MKIQQMTKAAALAALLLGGAAGAQEGGAAPRSGQGWSLHSGQTVGQGQNVAGAQLGWPGLSAELLHGATPKLDIGGKITPLNYGFEGRVRDVWLGLKLQLVTRLALYETSKFNVGVAFEPGPMFYFPPRRAFAFRSDTLVGLALPLSVSAGIPIGGAIMANFGMDLPMFVIFGTGGGFYLPILFGGGVEYYIDRQLSVSFNLKMGPSIATRTGTAEFAMDALIGAGYRF